MAASTITVKLSPREYAELKRFLVELRNIKNANAKRSQPVEVHPVSPQERHEIKQDFLSLNSLIDNI